MITLENKLQNENEESRKRKEMHDEVKNYVSQFQLVTNDKKNLMKETDKKCLIF